MKTIAAVAFEMKKPLEIVEIDLEGFDLMHAGESIRSVLVY
jgi:Zn-dependent alcohol dehydrogenase